MHRLTVICARHPWWTVAIALVLTAVAGWSALHTGTVVGTDAGLGPDHPAVRRFDDFLDRFGGGRENAGGHGDRDEQPAEVDGTRRAPPPRRRLRTPGRHIGRGRGLRRRPVAGEEREHGDAEDREGEHDDRHGPARGPGRSAGLLELLGGR